MDSEMAANVTLDNKAFTDPRFVMLGKSMGVPSQWARHWAIGAMATVWHHCTEEQIYSMSKAQLDAVICDGFADAALESCLAEITESGLVRIRGTEGRIEWLAALRNGRKNGGRNRANSATRGPGGTFLTSTQPAHQPAPNPAYSSAPTPTPTLIQDHILIDRLDFGALYQMYPRKEGKTKGLEYCRKKIKTQEDYDALKLAITNYSKAMKGKDKEYIKHFSTFMNCWRDYLEIAPAQAATPPQKFNISGIPTPEQRAENAEVIRELNKMMQEMN